MSGLTSDPISNVLIDWWLERGAKVDVWTDDEAERCRLVAFDVAQRTGPADHRGRWICGLANTGLGRNWGRDIEGWLLVVERFFSAFEPPDFSLEVSLDERLARELARGRRGCER